MTVLATMPTRRTKRPTVEGVTKTHPVVPLILNKKDTVTNALLPEFLEHTLAVHGQVIVDIDYLMFIQIH